MRTVEEYKAHAERMAKAFCAGESAGGNDLATLVEKTARDHRLNPEQIRRLSRATNVALFAEKYAAMKGQAHRRVDFTPVDEGVVIDKLQLNDGMAQAKLAHDLYPNLPGPQPAYTPQEKVAHIPELTERERVRRRGDAVKLAETLRIELEGLNILWNTKIAQLSNPCRHIGHDHLEFEKTAVAVCGSEVYTELNAIREALRLPALAVSEEKLAEIQDRLVASPNAMTKSLQEAINLRTAYGEKQATWMKVCAVKDALSKAVCHV